MVSVPSRPGCSAAEGSHKQRRRPPFRPKGGVDVPGLKADVVKVVQACPGVRLLVDGLDSLERGPGEAKVAQNQLSNQANRFQVEGEGQARCFQAGEL